MVYKGVVVVISGSRHETVFELFQGPGCGNTIAEDFLESGDLVCCCKLEISATIGAGSQSQLLCALIPPHEKVRKQAVVGRGLSVFQRVDPVALSGKFKSEIFCNLGLNKFRQVTAGGQLDDCENKRESKRL